LSSIGGPTGWGYGRGLIQRRRLRQASFQRRFRRAFEMVLLSASGRYGDDYRNHPGNSRSPSGNIQIPT
jgi:hypothetical protein